MNFSYYLRKFSKDSLYYGLGGALARFISIFTAPILTRIFTPADYGALDLVNTAHGVLLLFAGLNIISGVNRHYFEMKTPEDRNKLLSTGFLMAIIWGFVMLGITMLYKNQIADYIQKDSEIIRNYPLFLTLVFIRSPFNLAHQYFLNLLRFRKLAKQYVLITIVQIILNLVLIILLVVVLRLGIFGAFLAGTISGILISIYSYTFNYKYISTAFSKKYSKLILHYSLPQFPSVLINWGILQMNRFFLLKYCPDSELGYYSIANKVASIMMIAIMAFRFAWSPFSMEIMQKKNYKDLYNKFFRVSLIGFTFLAVLVSLNSKIIIRILAPITYLPAFNIIVFIVFGYTIQLINNILAVGIGIEKKTKYISYAQTIVFISTLIFNFIFIERYMAVGAGIAVMLSYFIQTICYLIFANMVHPIPFSLFNFVHYFVILIVTTIIVFFLGNLNMFNSIIVTLTSNLALFLYVWYVWMRMYERNLIIQFFKKKLNYLSIDQN